MYDKNYWAAVAVKSGVDANGTKFKKNYDEFWDSICNENMYYPVFLQKSEPETDSDSSSGEGNPSEEEYSSEEGDEFLK